MEYVDPSETITFAYTHRGGPYPLPPPRNHHHPSSRPWPPLPATMADQFCHDCSEARACEWIEEKEAQHCSRIRLLKRQLQQHERILLQNPCDPTQSQRRIQEQSLEIAQRNRRWRKELGLCRESWLSVWGEEQMSVRLDDVFERALTRSRLGACADGLESASR